jgi:hypothetical protein
MRFAKAGLSIYKKRIEFGRAGRLRHGHARRVRELVALPHNEIFKGIFAIQLLLNGLFGGRAVLGPSRVIDLQRVGFAGFPPDNIFYHIPVFVFNKTGVDLPFLREQDNLVLAEVLYAGGLKPGFKRLRAHGKADFGKALFPEL